MNPQVKVYYDSDADLSYLSNKNIGVIGYGIQGRAQSLNLRDSGQNIRVANRQDNYFVQAQKDGFDVMKPTLLSEWADIIFYLIPDDAQVEKFQSWIEPYMTEGKTIVFAHGYAIYNNRIKFNNNVDILLMAPRMPGKYIRDRFLRGWGAPVFIDVFQDYSGNGMNIVLALAKGIGATKIGAMHISLAEETEIDLFIEQFLLPRITSAIQCSFDYLISLGMTPEAVISEIYASKEIGKLLTDAGNSNLYQVFIDNASPTCQFGKMKNIDRAKNLLPNEHMELVMKEIRNSIFDDELKLEGSSNYKNLKKYNNNLSKTKIVKTHKNYNKFHLNDGTNNSERKY